MAGEFWNRVRRSQENFLRGGGGDGLLWEGLNRWVEIGKFLKVDGENMVGKWE